MDNQTINHLIATKVNNWTHDEGIFYHDSNNNICYLADYCISLPHAIDLAKAHGVALKPCEQGWEASKLDNEKVVATDALPSMAICLCLVSTLDAV